MTEKDRLYRNDRLFHLLEQPDHADLVFLLKNGLGKAEKKYGQYTPAYSLNGIKLILI
ncbi:MAG: hypothetical protein GY820_19140 [Gammaproteobacteria bacterium]|nr:hypothetical protein [Gammaproteobacteria bacterium]